MIICCLHCGLKAYVAGQPPENALFDESPEAHLARCHPDLEAVKRERAELEPRALALMRRERQFSDNARNN